MDYYFDRPRARSQVGAAETLDSHEEGAMPKYLFKANYTQTGLEGLVIKGAASRVVAINELTASVGGTVESVNYALGETDLYVIADLPDDEAAAGLALRVGAAGGATVETVKLLTPEQVDEALGRQVAYRPPGS
jgi:uncharacterized protein with GYD domain